MIDTVLKLLDKLTQLAKHRKEIEEKTFDFLIKPIYTDMEAIHTDYLKMFEKCQQELGEGEKIKTIAKQLRIDRLKLEGLRRRLIKFIESYSINSKLSGYNRFFSSVEIYLCVPYDRAGKTSSLKILRHLEKVDESKLSVPEIEEKRAILSRILGGYLFTMRKSWGDISTEYAKLLAKIATS